MFTLCQRGHWNFDTTFNILPLETKQAASADEAKFMG